MSLLDQLGLAGYLSPWTGEEQRAMTGEEQRAMQFYSQSSPICIHPNCPICKECYADKVKLIEENKKKAEEKKLAYQKRCEDYMIKFRKASAK